MELVDKIPDNPKKGCIWESTQQKGLYLREHTTEVGKC